MKDKYLPIGSVVILNGGIKKIMITGYFCSPADRKDLLFDYRGCPFPEGIIDSRGVALFNNSDIREIVHTGYKNDESINFLDKMEILRNKQN